MKNDSILRGYTTQATAYEVKDYPYGFRLRTSIFYWVESHPKKGDRLGTYTINPKNGRANKPKYSTYSTFIYLYINDEGHVKHQTFDSYNRENFINRFSFIVEKYGEEFLSKDQKDNLRMNHYAHVRGNAPYDARKYSEAARPAYLQWLKDTLHHIAKSEFKNMVDYPEAPAQDNPDAQIFNIQPSKTVIIG